MTIDKINRSLKERFSQPLKDCYERRIVFWFDPERQFESILPELDLPNVKLLQLRENDLFAAKRLLSETDTVSDYLVYDPLVYADHADNWLRDIQLYSEEFRADLISMLMDELNIPQTVQFRRAMKHYIKFFESKERIAKLAALGTNYENPGQLHISIMAVLSGTKQNTVSGVLRAILCDSLYNEDNRALVQIQKFGSEQAFWEMVARYTGYCDDKRRLSDLAVHILLTAFSTVGDDGVLAGLERFITPENQPACYAFIDEWNSSPESGRLFDIAADISERFGLAARLEKLDTEALLRSDGLPCVDEAIIGRYMKEIGEGTIKIDEILKACESRRTSNGTTDLHICMTGCTISRRCRNSITIISRAFISAHMPSFGKSTSAGRISWIHTTAACISLSAKVWSILRASWTIFSSRLCSPRKIYTRAGILPSLTAVGAR